MGVTLPLLFTVFLVSSVVRAAVLSTGFTVSLANIDYFLPPKPIAKISDCQKINVAFNNDLFVPFAVVKGGGSEALASIITAYAEDDVWQEGFLEALYVQDTSQCTNTSQTILSGTASSELPPGPYFLNAACQVFEAWRLFSDVQGTFTESAISNGDGSYSVLPASTVGQKHAIAVPSRLYFKKTAEKPLAGVRIGIKDVYDIKGLRTSNGNRAWYWLYPPASNTAPAVQNLIDAGAVIVGKMVTSQFANGESATADWVDYQEAFNPRGDGYQDTQSSSSGSGAGAGSYSWLDLTLGSDTGGSVRSPAQAQGVYGNRPSHGLISLNYTMPLSPILDTAGLFARDPVLWKQAAHAMYGPKITLSTAYPRSIKTLSWPTSSSNVPDKLLIEFLRNVTKFLGANTTAYNISSSFQSDNPDLPLLTTFLNLTYATLITKQQTELVRDPFYTGYTAKYDGRFPFVNPVPFARWIWADSLAPPLEEAIHNKTTFMAWANATLLAPSASTCSESLVLYVGSTARTNYRNVYRGRPTVPFGFLHGDISIMAEAPDFVVPIGEAPYDSAITGHLEYLPVTANLMAAKGCDWMLFSLIEDLYKAGILKKVLPGRSGITGEEILLRRSLYDY